MFARVSHFAAWPALLAAFAIPASALSTAGGRFPDGAIVRYVEDLEGYDWKVVRQHEFGRYEIRRLDGPNGMLCIADVDEMTPVRP